MEEKLLRFLADDLGQGDITSTVVVDANCTCTAEVVAKEEGVVAGLEEADVLAEALGLQVDVKAADGDVVQKGQRLLVLSGDARTVLNVERTLLNLLSRMSGIATATRNLSEKIKKAHFNAKVAATRKSAPGLLYFDKKAVVIGGGDPHRLHLDDLVLIKDNHIAVAGSMKKAVNLAKQNVSFTKKIEVEVTSPADALMAAELGANIVMLDNFQPAKAKEAVDLLRKGGFAGRVLIEASGGIGEENILEYAAAGADLISLGELTHSAKALDISLEIIKAD